MIKNSDYGIPWLNFSPNPASTLGNLDDLLARDKQRVRDGLPPKIKIGKIVKPGKGSNKVVIIPSVEEERFLHDQLRDPSGEGQSSGQGEGEEGEIIGEQPMEREGEGDDGEGAGQGGGQGHDTEQSTYELGKILTQKFDLPNLKDKGKKRALSKYVYDLTDRNLSTGQFMDKKATLRKIVETNIALGRLNSKNIVTDKLLISPRDKVYRVLSREKYYESQAMVFFLRDYSGSMSGGPTEVIVRQHLLIYSWLLFQYNQRVEHRFIVHDDEAKVVPDFDTYYNSKVAGGTRVSEAYKLVNEIVKEEGLASQYNIYVFHGTDGDDFEIDGKEAIAEITQTTSYANRLGITLALRNYGAAARKTAVESYINASGLLKKLPKLIRMHSLPDRANDDQIVEGIKYLVSE